MPKSNEIEFEDDVEDSVGPGFIPFASQAMPSVKRSITVSLPAYPTDGAEGLKVHVTQEQTGLDSHVEVSTEGVVRTHEEYTTLVELITNLT